LFPVIVNCWPMLSRVVLTENVVPAGNLYVPAAGVTGATAFARCDELGIDPCAELSAAATMASNPRAVTKRYGTNCLARMAPSSLPCVWSA